MTHDDNETVFTWMKYVNYCPESLYRYTAFTLTGVGSSAG